MRYSLVGGLGALCCVHASATRRREIRAAAANRKICPNLSIEQLANIQVRSASKREEPLSAVPAAMYVIDHDQIARSGAQTIPEILRVAPNLQVYQQSPSHYVITARGTQWTRPRRAELLQQAARALIDGRTIYTPLFSGVYWDLPGRAS